MVWYGDSPETSNNKKIAGNTQNRSVAIISSQTSSHTLLLQFEFKTQVQSSYILSPQNDDIYVQFFVWYPLTQD